VERGDLDFAGVDGLEDSGQEAQPDAVAQLGVFESQATDFAKHFASVGVTMGVPAG
jgi:hypothetical protein